MDALRFDALVRSLNLLAPRRTALGMVGGGLALLARFGIEDIEAKRKNKKKKKCKPCRKKKKGKCKGKKPDGTLCGEGMTCQNGKCVSDPQAAECTSNNDFCAQQWASCLEMPECRCFVTVENDGICGNTTTFTGCPEENECATSADCGGETDFCVSLPCCPEGKTACRPLCVTV